MDTKTLKQLALATAIIFREEFPGQEIKPS